MKKVLFFVCFLGFLACASLHAATRDGTTMVTTPRTAQSRTAPSSTRTSSTADPARVITTRNMAPIRQSSTRVSRAGVLRTTTPTRTIEKNKTREIQIGRNAANTARNQTKIKSAKNISARATTSNQVDTNETNTGAAYNQCKTAYFQCMDQFCQLKNDDYRRCSCSARIYDLMAVRTNLTETNDKLTQFTENLDIVGMTAAQATAIRTSSDGENALTADTSASKALLTAIMNSIRGEDPTVVGKMSDLNSINLSIDTMTSFGTSDTAQIIASYNGTELYKAVYQSCRNIVKDDCNDAALQRAVTAYLMAIEQDCNTVQTVLTTKQKELKAAIREGSAMLDLARVENRQKHNSSDKATCIANVEKAILSEEVCGANYHKCLDNGEFIDITTGAPITGVVKFYELANLLKFESGRNAAEQKLAQNPSNLVFVNVFESKTKKFALDELDKCTEIADEVWQEYLDKALLDIYYAQQSKVEEIKNGCFDLISSCYSDREKSITAAMAELIDGVTELPLMPNKIVLTHEMCTDYIDSCNNMFDNNIIAEYVERQKDTDTLTACRAIIQQCFTRFGGANYENFYNPKSGLFTPNIVDSFESTASDANSAFLNELSVLDWFSLYAYDSNGVRQPGYRSKCAQQLAEIESCAAQIEKAFGGLDMAVLTRKIDTETGMYTYGVSGNDVEYANTYGLVPTDSNGNADPTTNFTNRRLRPTGVATEVYNQIIDILTTRCINVDGKFVEAQYIDHTRYGTTGDLCVLKNNNINFKQYGLAEWPTSLRSAIYNATPTEVAFENMCPKDYAANNDTSAWGACLCWENGGRRSKYGLAEKCTPSIPITGPKIATISEPGYGTFISFVEPDKSLPINYFVSGVETSFTTSDLPNNRGCAEYLNMFNVYVNYVNIQSDPLRSKWSTDDPVNENTIHFWCKSTINSATNQVCPLDKQTPSDCETYLSNPDSNQPPKGNKS